MESEKYYQSVCDNLSQTMNKFPKVKIKEFIALAELTDYIISESKFRKIRSVKIQYKINRDELQRIALILTTLKIAKCLELDCIEINPLDVYKALSAIKKHELYLTHDT